MTTPEDRQFGPKGVEDMITLDNLTEETMLRNLQHRYNKNLIYTFTGSILISMNPYKVLPIYEQDTVQRYTHTLSYNIAFPSCIYPHYIAAPAYF